MLKLDVIIASVIALLAGFIFYPFASIGVDPHHDGIMLKPALDVFSGQVLFRDTFSQYGPLTTYLQALVLNVQPTLLSLRLLSVVAYAGSLGLLYLAWRGLLPRSLALIAVLLFLVSIPFFIPDWQMLPWSSTLALFFQSFALLAFMRLVAGNRAGVWAWTLGIACACTLWCRQPVGIILSGSVGVIAVGLHFTGWRHPHCFAARIWMRVAAGFAGVSILILGHLAMNGALGAWWEQTIIWPRRWAAGSVGTVFWIQMRFFFLRIEVLIFIGVAGIVLLPGFIRRFYVKLPPLADPVWWCLLIVFYFAIARDWVRPALLLEQGGWRQVILCIIVLQAFIVIARACAPPKAGLLMEYYLIAVLSGLSLGSAAQVYPMACANHQLWALAPGFGVFVWFIHKRLGLLPNWCGLALLILIAPAAYEKYRWSGYKIDLPLVELKEPAVLRGLRLDSEQAAAIGRVQDVVVKILREDYCRSVILYGDDAMYLAWFNNRYNPSPYYVTWSDLLTRAEASKRMNYVVTQRPVLLLNGPNVAQLIVVPEDYEMLINEPLLDLRIMVPRHVLDRIRSNFDLAAPIR